MLPGSRSFEVEWLLRPILRSFVKLHEKDRALKGVLVVAPSVNPDKIQMVLQEELTSETLKSVQITKAPAQTVMRLAQVGILKSGTCNLEAACAGLPFVCIYRGALYAKILAKFLLPIDQYSPVNIIRRSTVVELVDTVIKPENIVAETARLLNDAPYRTTVMQSLREVDQSLRAGGGSASQHVAEVALQMVK